MKTTTAHWLRRSLFSPWAQRAWGLVLAILTLAVLGLALAPLTEGPTLGWDKANHTVAFAALAFCGLYATPNYSRAAWVAAGLLAFGALIELAQTQVPGRSADWVDVVADGVGIALGLVAARLLAKPLERRSRPREAAPLAKLGRGKGGSGGKPRGGKPLPAQARNQTPNQASKPAQKPSPARAAAAVQPLRATKGSSLRASSSRQ